MTRWVRPVLLACLLAAGGAVVAGTPAGAGRAVVPRPDHVVVVVEENRSYDDVVGDPDAPYLNQLAAAGALFSSSFALLPGSQPNYLGLFSGSLQGVTDNSCPHTFTAPSLGGQLIAAGLGFTGYSDSLPSAGYTGCSAGAYVRRHNPWVDFTDVPASANVPFSAFPTDYTTLPAVSFVVPDLDDDMHDAMIAGGDAWLSTHLGDYASWASAHNSLLVVTFDEDSGHSAEQIPTLVYGANVRPGTYDETINHYSLLRTLEDAFGLPALGAAASTAPILDIWAPPAGDDGPTASFTPSCSGLSCTFDASGSTGSPTGWSWDFGDGTSSTDPTPQHTYAAGGPWRVRLTVADGQGATDTTAQPLQLADPAAFAADSFARTVSGGLGSADTGGAWALSGPASAFGVAPGLASMSATAAPASLAATLSSATTNDADLRLSAGVPAVPAGGQVAVVVAGRRVGASAEYDAKLLLKSDHSIGLRLVRIVNGAETVLADVSRVSGLSTARAAPVDLRVQVVGTSSTVLRAKAWRPQDAEPTAWTLTASDSAAALQTAGSVGLGLRLASGVTTVPLTAQFGPLSAAHTGTVPPPPVSTLRDTFARTVTAGWGDADIGGAWTTTGSASAFSVTPGAGALALKAGPATLAACACTIAQTDGSVVTTFSLSAVPTGGPVNLEIEGRHAGFRTGYAAKLVLNADKTMTLRLVRAQSGTETILAGPVRVPGATVAAGRAFTVRVQVTGTAPTTLRARAWLASGMEPVSWLVTGTDATASLQAPGAVGLLALSPSGTKADTVRVSSVTAGAAA